MIGVQKSLFATTLRLGQGGARIPGVKPSELVRLLNVSLALYHDRHLVQTGEKAWSTEQRTASAEDKQVLSVQAADLRAALVSRYAAPDVVRGLQKAEVRIRRVNGVMAVLGTILGIVALLVMLSRC